MIGRVDKPLCPQPVRNRVCSILAVILTTMSAAAVQAAAKPTFDDIAKVLHEHCVVCHSGPAAPADLRLDTLAGLKAGSSNGRVAVPRDPASSELVRRLRDENLYP